MCVRSKRNVCVRLAERVLNGISFSTIENGKCHDWILNLCELWFGRVWVGLRSEKHRHNRLSPQEQISSVSLSFYSCWEAQTQWRTFFTIIFCLFVCLSEIIQCISPYCHYLFLSLFCFFSWGGRKSILATLQMLMAKIHHQAMCDRIFFLKVFIFIFLCICVEKFYKNM